MIKSHQHRFVSLLLLIGGIAISQISFADNTKEAKKKFKEGIAHIRQENYTEALKAFEASYALNPKPAVLLNIGMANKALYRYIEAIDAFEKFLKNDHKSITPKQRKAVRKALAELYELVGTLQIEGAPTGAEVVIEDKISTELPLERPLILAPGRYVLEVRLEGHEPFKSEFNIVSGGETKVMAKLTRAKTSLYIECNEAKGVVYLDGEVVGGCPFDEKIEPGPHTVVVEAPGKKRHTEEINGESGQAIHLPVNLMPAQVTPIDEASGSGGSAGLKIAGWTSLGLGVAGTAVGSVFLFSYMADRNEVLELHDKIETATTQAEYNQFRTDYLDAKKDFEDNTKKPYTIGAAVGLGAGVALITTGIVLLVVNKKREPESQKAMAITPTLGGVAVQF